MSENQNQGCIKCGHTEIEEGTLSQQDQDCLNF